MKIKSFGKINLNLRVLDELVNGLHKIESLIVPIDLYDVIEIKEINNDKDIITFDSMNIPENNTVSKSLNLYKYLSIERNITISNRIHCDIYESIIGAIYFDSNNTRIVKKIVKKTLIDQIIKFEDIIDYKGEIINFYNKKIINDLNINTDNLLNSKKFISSINISRMYFYGFGKNKLDAEQRASFLAISYINNN